ncbi:hypothetical protein [Vibrio vulnificus]|uniref:hypothetical protein n=1 Tax=Vibrio vulnificus TaxID=672 RepID=UPI001028CD68|nr:hypothetical protein [Vibrio vulnificus]EGQ8024375.1 hypothetical protein [Vibrio vulnificus]
MAENQIVAIIQTLAQVSLTLSVGYYIARKMERLKTDLTKKFWVKQQVWDTRKSAYDDLIRSFYETKEYLDFLIEYTNEYLEAFERIGTSEQGDESSDRAYEEYVASEQLEFNRKYETSDAIAERKRISKETRQNLEALNKAIDIRSIYLHPDIQKVRADLNDILHKLFEDVREKHSDEALEDYLDEQIEGYQELLKQLSDAISRTERIASMHLELKNS